MGAFFSSFGLATQGTRFKVFQMVPMGYLIAVRATSSSPGRYKGFSKIQEAYRTIVKIQSFTEIYIPCLA